MVYAAIRFFSRCRYNHVDIVDGNGLLGSRPIGGVAVRQPHTDEVAHLYLDVWVPDEGAAMAFTRAQIGKPYDFLSVLGAWWQRNWHDPDRWMCSELVAAALEQGGAFTMPAPNNRVAPADLLIACQVARQVARQVAPSS